MYLLFHNLGCIYLCTQITIIFYGPCRIEFVSKLGIVVQVSKSIELYIPDHHITTIEIWKVMKAGKVLVLIICH